MSVRLNDMISLHYPLNYQKIDFSYGNTAEVYVKHATSSCLSSLTSVD